MFNLVTDFRKQELYPISLKSVLTKDGKSEIVLNGKEVKIEGAESKHSALLVVVADPRTGIILE